ncbi:MAG: hypothetical protein PWP04_1236 [Candidatus Atribacteria bacterium]|nr:hypothetical protein [Candidatus Atribacteria bacterium]
MDGTLFRNEWNQCPDSVGRMLRIIQESMKWYPYLEVMAKRPKAIKYTRFFNELPDIWKDYLESQDRERKKLTITALMKMMEGDDEEGLVNATRALAETLRRGVRDIYSKVDPIVKTENKLF